MEYALKFANTGHLCLTTLHANNAVSALERMMTFFPPEDQNNEVCASPRTCAASCPSAWCPPWQGGKCAAVEVMINTPRIQDLITKQDLSELRNTIEQGSKYQMRTFDQALIELYEKGKVSAETAIDSPTRRTTSPCISVSTRATISPTWTWSSTRSTGPRAPPGSSPGISPQPPQGASGTAPHERSTTILPKCCWLSW
jgi:hypothetical protein